jgi:hypothetical protein
MPDRNGPIREQIVPFLMNLILENTDQVRFFTDMRKVFAAAEIAPRITTGTSATLRLISRPKGSVLVTNGCMVKNWPPSSPSMTFSSFGLSLVPCPKVPVPLYRNRHTSRGTQIIGMVETRHLNWTGPYLKSLAGIVARQYLSIFPNTHSVRLWPITRTPNLSLTRPAHRLIKRTSAKGRLRRRPS